MASAAAFVAGMFLLAPLSRPSAQQFAHATTQGQMGPGMMGQGMMGPGMMGSGMMGSGMMGQGMMGQSFIMVPARPILSAADVKYNLERLLSIRGNSRLKVRNVTEKDQNTIVGDIVTVDGSLVEQYEVDKVTSVARLVP